MGRKSYAEGATAKLLDLWTPPAGAGDPVGCLATTYTFDAQFFEEQCLARFAGIEGAPEEDLHSYLVEREERLAAMRAVVFVDGANAPDSRSLRWHVLAMRVARGVFHPKVTLLAWAAHVRVIVGSANVTEAAFRTNLEQVASLDFHEGGALPRELLEDVLDFLGRCVVLSPGAERDAPGPGRGARDLLADVRSTVSRWGLGTWKSGSPRIAWIGLMPGSSLSVLDQIRERAWSGTPASEAWVLTPFFDQGDGARDTLARLVASMGKQGEREVHVVTTGNELPSGQVELNVPEALPRHQPERTRLRFHVVRASSEKGDLRPLHAKSLWLERDGRATYLVGSSNFTRAGLGYDVLRCNVEANVAYVIPDTDGEFARRCQAGYPVHDEIDPERISFLRSQEETPGDADQVPLPAGFEQAIFVVSGKTPHLELWITAAAPAEFRVLHAETSAGRDSGEKILDSHAWRVARETPARWPWPVPRPPSSLLVVWTDNGGVERRSVWPVNVDDPSRLPPPDELRELSLEEILDVLSSALPLHEAWSRLRRKHRTADVAPALDPHEKVDTSRHLLRRMARVASAVEGLRERLERPAYTADAMAWRLRTGPVSPLRLAERLAAEESIGASFFIAEVALAVRRADLRLSEERLGRVTVAAEREAVLAALRARAAAHPAPANLAAYVADALAESGP